MNTSQHDKSVNTGSSRPADPDARQSGKAVPKNQRQRQPSDEEDDDADEDDDPVERLVTGDLLVGAAAIRAFLVELGIPRKTADPYYLKRTGRWPIGNTGGDGGKIIASKRRLIHHADKLARGSPAA